VAFACCVTHGCKFLRQKSACNCSGVDMIYVRLGSFGFTVIPKRLGAIFD